MNPLVQFISARFSHRVASRHSGHSSSLISRIEVCPPELWPSSVTLWGRVRRWMAKDSPWTTEASRPPNRLAIVKAEFRSGMDQLEGRAADRLADQIERARSLRELWHLRSALYGLLALHFDQAEAERRLADLNHHFPIRAPRCGITALET